jgi:hypothetical protein
MLIDLKSTKASLKVRYVLKGNKNHVRDFCYGPVGTPEVYAEVFAAGAGRSMPSPLS